MTVLTYYSSINHHEIRGDLRYKIGILFTILQFPSDQIKSNRFGIYIGKT